MPAPRETQAATVQKFIEGWTTGTTEGTIATWSDDAQQQILPHSLGMPVRSKAEVADFLPQMLSLLSNFKLEIHDVILDPTKNKAVLYAKGTADTVLRDFKWGTEYCVFLTLTEDGTQVKKLEEMIDTAFFKEFSAKLEEFKSNQST